MSTGDEHGSVKVEHAGTPPALPPHVCELPYPVPEGMHPGTVVRCKCGLRYTLVDDVPDFPGGVRWVQGVLGIEDLSPKDPARPHNVDHLLPRQLDEHGIPKMAPGPPQREAFLP